MALRAIVCNAITNKKAQVLSHLGSGLAASGASRGYSVN